MVELTPEDIQFFSNEENWMFGPTYDLELVTVSASLGALQEAILGFPGLMAWQPRRDQARSILRAENGVRPFGVLRLERDSESNASVMLVIYPPHLRYVCGFGIWELSNTDASINALRGVHNTLFELTRWVHHRVLLEEAFLHDETRSMPDIENPSGHFWMQADVANSIGWMGRTVQDWVGVQL